MGFFQSILDFFRRLIGRPREPVLSLGSTGKPPPPSASDEDEDEDEADGEGDGDDATRDGQANIEDEWADLQVFVARCEADGLAVRVLRADAYPVRELKDERFLALAQHCDQVC